MELSYQMLADCLKTCNMPSEVREQILACAGKECRSRQLHLLTGQRVRLLGDLHQAQRRIDLLDLLIHTLRKELP